MMLIDKWSTRTSKVAPIVKTVLISAVTYLLLVVLLLLGITPEQHDIQVGAPAGMDIMATKDVNDVVTTERKRDEAAAAVEPSYKSMDTTVLPEVLSDIEARFEKLSALREDPPADSPQAITDEELNAVSESLGIEITRDRYVALIAATPETYNALFADVNRFVRDMMNSSLLEGQEAAGVNVVLRSLSSAAYPMSLVNLTNEVLTDCVRPNMLVDEEATEANRQKARDAVETETCVKGEVIVRRGEIVTNAQYQMLSQLGLLKEDNLDVQLILGIALVVLIIMIAMALFLLRYRPDLLSPRQVMLMSLISVIVMALSLGISRWNTYLMPVSLGMMLVALLIDRRTAIYYNIALAMMISLLADAAGGLFTVGMFSTVMAGLVSGPVILLVFSRSMQRTTSLYAGVLAGISNFLVTMAVGLINSTEINAVMINAFWSMCSGVLSAVLCIGIQPMMESMFNLATNARLIELSNPNQPLLRRLLLEAPGTYHHAIIVANLAEAATTAIGGNGLLARVGAYYHDVGKLKRPIYFAENQMGDNPHDRTDPRVSAAILTAHPRDGAAMAVKARIPGPVVNIIRRHHGDGVALWFYDKAVKLYGADNVDIAAFRYDGPRPHTKEEAVVMLADSIEAAVRSMSNPDPEKVDALIRKLVRGKMDDGQLDESNLTFGDLEKICSAFSTVLTGVYHERIEYPDVTPPPRAERSEAPKPAPVQRPTTDAAAQHAPKAPQIARTDESRIPAPPAPQPISRPAPDAVPKPAAEATKSAAEMPKSVAEASTPAAASEQPTTASEENAHDD